MKYFYLCVLCLTIVGFLIRSETKKNNSVSVALKSLASLCFVILGFLSARLSKDGQLAHNVLSGLCLGLIADVLLNMRYLFRQKRDLVFLAGIIVFLAGHIFYIVALSPKCGCLPVCLPPVQLIGQGRQLCGQLLQRVVSVGEGGQLVRPAA